MEDAQIAHAGDEQDATHDTGQVDRQGEKLIAFVLYPGLTVLDLVGPLQVLNSKGPVYRTVVVGEHLQPVETDTPLSVAPDKTFEEVPRPHILIVPGGGLPTYRAMANATIMNYVRSAADGAELVCSVCTGALILAAAGLLQGRRATTHWAHYKMLERLGAHYVHERWVEDGKFITAAGVSAGIDMALFLLAKIKGEDIARQVQIGIEYDPQPPFGRIDWSGVDRNVIAPLLEPQLESIFAERPDLLSRLKG